MTTTQASSSAATIPWVVASAYGAAKAALEHLIIPLTVLLVLCGISVNAVRPGFVWSVQWTAVSHDEFDAGTAVTKEQTAEDVAGAVTFLPRPACASSPFSSLTSTGGCAHPVGPVASCRAG